MANRLLIATRSAAKARELRALLSLPGVELVSLDELGIADEIPEEGATFDENATNKALAYARISGLAVIADDSGLEVDFLGGAPGVRTRRFAGPTASDEENNRYLLKLLQGVPAERRTARYRCALALAEPALAGETREPAAGGPSPGGPRRTPSAAGVALIAVTHGTLDGRIAASPKGTRGFGYDPIFEPAVEAPGGRTLAQYSPAAKNRISHRGRAARAMRRDLERFLLS